MVAALTASDPDLGLNSHSGEVRTRWRLGREEQEKFLVVVMAEDGAQENLSPTWATSGRCSPSR